MLGRSMYRSVLISAASLAAIAGSASAQQNVSGGGRILDANLSRTDGRLNYRNTTLEDQLRLNNAIITGQAGAGRAFRGSVGYGATDQFGGTTSDNSNYGFRRDSAGSAFTGLGLRTSDALRYQFGMTAGGYAAPVGGGYGGASAFGSIVPQSPVSTAGGGTQGGPSSMRSTAEWATAAALRPVVIGARQDELGAQYLAKASPLTGIRWVKVADSPLGPVAPAGPTALTPGTPEPKPVSPTGMTVPTAVVPSPVSPYGTQSEPTGAVPTTPTPAIKPGDTTTPPLSQPVPTAPASVRTESAAYTRIMDRLATSYEATGVKATTPDAKAPPVNEALVRLRRLLGQEPAQGEQTGKSATDATAKPQTPSDKGDKGEKNTPTKPRLGELPKPSDTLESFNDPAVVALVKTLRSNADVRVESLVPIGQAANTTYNEPVAYAGFMKAGEEAMAKSRFFVAEDQFNRAIGVMTRDPMARVGRTHAQLGAGLYLSAAANLRVLFSENPELLAQRYGEALLPKPDRIDKIVEQLRIEMASSNGALGREAGLLIAYLGYQRGIPAVVTMGLDSFAERIAPDEEGRADRALLAVLRQAWVGDAVPAK